MAVRARRRMLDELVLVTGAGEALTLFCVSATTATLFLGGESCERDECSTSFSQPVHNGKTQRGPG